MPETPARGIHNCNPGNIRRNASVTWRGSAGCDDDGFLRFEAPAFGLRAIARILLSFQRRGVTTPRTVAHGWLAQRAPGAPVASNDVGAFALLIADALNVTRTRVIDLRDPDVMAVLIGAVVMRENGEQPYTAAQIDHAMDLALLDNHNIAAALDGGAEAKAA